MHITTGSEFADQPLNIRLSEVIGALSYALDITEGQPAGHAARTCMLGMRIGREIGLNSSNSSALFYALLLKDLGCSSTASKICYLFGSDDRVAKRDVKTVDWSKASRKISYFIEHIAPQSSVLRRAWKFAQLAVVGNKAAKELVVTRCERGARIASQMQLPAETSVAIHALDEHWDGMGHPDGLMGDQIPLLARILGLAQTAEVFVREQGVTAALEMARQRSGSWFEPELVNIFLSMEHDTAFWTEFNNAQPRMVVAGFEPSDQTLTADPRLLDCIAQGFAEVIDAKSPWTCKHSEGVADISVGIAEVMGFDAQQRRYIRRAALLHDIGKLGISNMILDKPAKLSAEELTEMRKHPRYTYEILNHVAGFRNLAELAAAHHERLDGKGYHLGLTAEQLSTPARILGVADMYEALTAKRPYRADLSSSEALAIIAKNVGTGLCPAVFDALKVWVVKGNKQPTRLAA